MEHKRKLVAQSCTDQATDQHGEHALRKQRGLIGFFPPEAKEEEPGSESQPFERIVNHMRGFRVSNHCCIFEFIFTWPVLNASRTGGR